jgi:co-chaperonin GroES (HSP10)
VNLNPLPGKVLILPDPTERTTDAGLLVVEHWPMEVSGTVVAVGASKHPRKDEAFALADELGCPGPVEERAAQLLRELTGREPDVAVGDRVVFGLSAGQEIRIDETRYFLMNETDLLAVLSAEDDVAA